MGPFMQDAFKKIAEQSGKQEQSAIGELQKEITELHRQLAESEKGEREAQEYGEEITRDFKQYMTESKREIKALQEMNANLKKQRDHLLSGYHAEVMG